jgi:hypothetical protein
MFDKPAPAPAPQAAAQTVAPAPKAAAVEEKPAPVAEKPAPRKPVVASVEKKPERPKATKPASGAAKLELVVTPWGEVLIDGKSRGISTGRKAFDLPPGAHTIEIRNSTFPAHVQKVQVKAGDTLRITHRFK